MRISDWSSDVCSSDLFVLAFGWGVAGVAWATLIAESTAAAAGLTLILWRVGRPHAADWLRLKEPARLAALMRVNLDIFLRTLCLVLVFGIFTSEGAGFGDVVLRSEEHTSELQSLLRISYAVFCLKKKKIQNTN